MIRPAFVETWHAIVERPDEWSRLYQQESETLDTLELKVDPDASWPSETTARAAGQSPVGKDMQSVPRRFLVGKAFFIYWPTGFRSSTTVADSDRLSSRYGGQHGRGLSAVHCPVLPADRSHETDSITPLRLVGLVKL